MKVAPTSGTPCGRGGLYGRPDPRRSPTKWVRRMAGWVNITMTLVMNTPKGTERKPLMVPRARYL